MGMTIFEFDDYVKRTREGFKDRLRYNDQYLFNIDEFVILSFKSCTNCFEEQTLIENLKEEYGLYLESLVGRAV